MSLNVSVYSDLGSDPSGCTQAIGKRYYDLIATLEEEGEDHLFHQVGQRFDIDISPLGMLLYTDGEIEQEDIDESMIDAGELREMVQKLVAGIRSEPQLPAKLGLKYEELPEDANENFREALFDLVSDPAKLADTWEKQEKLRLQHDINLFIEYFNSGELLRHLETLLKSIECYIGKGAEKIYFTAG